MLRRPGGGDHPQRAAERRVGAAARARRNLGAVRRSDDRYLRERKGDVADVVGRLCMNLRAAGDPADLFQDVEGPLVLVADELTPSVIAQLDWQRLAAFVTDAGSWTYHTAILARSIRVPAVAGLRNASALIPPGALVAVDGLTGRGPRRSGRRHAGAGHAQPAAAPRLRATLEHFRTLPAVTQDGIEIRLEANIEMPEDARARAGARRGGHRPVPIGVPARRQRHGGAHRRGAVRRLPPADRERGAGPRHGPDLRRQRGAAAAGARRARGRPRAARPARHAPEPGVRRDRSRRSCGRCCARPCTGRCASCSRSSPASRSCAPRGRPCSARREALRGAGRRRRRRRRSAS